MKMVWETKSNSMLSAVVYANHLNGDIYYVWEMEYIFCFSLKRAIDFVSVDCFFVW